jgi:predicted ABC-type ATPase
MATPAEKLNAAVEASRRAALADEPRLEAAYLAQLRNVLQQAVSRYKAIAGLNLTASADWTPPSVADVLDIQVRTARIRDAQRRMMARLAGTVAEISGVDFNLTSPMTQDILDGLGVRAAQLGETLREPVAAAIARGWAQGLSVPETARLIARTLKPQLAAKATMLARTDLIGMSNGAGQGVAKTLNEAAKASNEPPPISTKQWLSSHDARVRDTHASADGQRVPIDQPYNVGGEPLMYPGDPSGSNAETINCRCTELYDDAPKAKPSPKDAAVMEGRSPLVNEMLGPHVDTREKFMLSEGGGYTAERTALHREIVEEFLSKGEPVPLDETPSATFLAGGSGAGKSTVKRTLQAEGRFPTKAVDIDPDAIKERLPEYQRAVEVSDKYGARIVHEESSDIAKMVLEEAKARRMNVVIDGTGDSEPGKFVGKIEQQAAAGYDVDVVMVDIPTDEAVVRAQARFERSGRYVPEKVIRQIHGDVAARFTEWRDSPAVRRWELWANEGKPPVLVAEKMPGFGTVVRQPRRYREFLKKGGHAKDAAPFKEFVSRKDLHHTFVGEREGKARVIEALDYLDEIIDPEAFGAAQDLMETTLPNRSIPILQKQEEGSSQGTFYSSARYPTKIDIRLDGSHPGTTTLHEVGHLIDHSALSEGRWATNKAGVTREVDAAMAKLMRRATTTKTMNKLFEARESGKVGVNVGDRTELVAVPEQIAKWIDYASTNVEVWARLFAQWSARRPGAPERLRAEMAAEIEKEQKPDVMAYDLPGQWSDREMEELGPLIEDVLRAGRVLKTTGSFARARVGPVDPYRHPGVPVREPLPGFVLREPFVLDDQGDDLVVGESLGAGVVDGDHPDEATTVELGDAEKTGSRGDPVRRGGLGRARRAAAVRERRRTEGAGGEASGSRIREARRASEAARSREARVAARTAPGAAVPSGGELPPEGTMTIAPSPLYQFAARAPVADDAALGAAWESDLAFEGLSTGDGRYIAAGALGWREPPLTLMAMVETTQGGHLGAQVSGRMDTFEKRQATLDGARLPDGVTSIYGTGFFDTGEYGVEIERMVDGKVLSGISVDMSIEDWAFRDPETGEIIDPETATDDQWERAFLGELEMAVTAGTIMAATVCPTPAFADAKIALLASAGSHFGHTWRANAYAAEAFGIEVGQLCTTLHAPLTVVEDDSLTAAAAFPVKPPKDWFFTPEADRAVPLTFTEDGRVSGHIAAWHSCHTGYLNGAWSQCVTPPRSRTDYAHFHVGEIPTAEGDLVPHGKLMLGEAHAPGAGTREGARAFYDRTGTIGCYVRAVDGKHGIWVSGAVKNDLTDTQLRDLHCNPPSGDWRSVDGNLELIAAIAVPVPGYPIPRSQLSLAAAADGEMFVASLILTPDWSPVDTFEAEALAAEIEAGADGLAALIDA